MIPFLRNFLNIVEAEPERVAVVDHDGKRFTTYRELCSCAFRVNAWMRAHGLGRESVSAIYFPKCMEYVAARIGIIMAGGAWVGLEDLMGKERMRFVIRDSGCKAVFDREKWAEAMHCDECHEIADSDLHDLAFIIYTSGSTGTPKGIMAHPALLSTIVKKNRSYFLQYHPEFDREIPVEEMSDEALDEEAEHFVRPFCLDGTPLLRCRIIRAEKKRAVLLDVYHVICDGISLGKLISDFGTSYAGGEIAPDRCYSLLREEASYRTSGHFQKDMDYFAAVYDRPGWDTLPRPDHDSSENTDDTIFKAFRFLPEEADSLMKKYGFGKCA